MKISKKILSIFLAVSIMLSLAVPSFAANSAKEYQVIEYEGIDFSCAEIGIGWYGTQFYYNEANGKIYSFGLLESGKYALVDMLSGEVALEQFTYQGRTYCPNGAVENNGEVYFTVIEGTSPEPSRFFAIGDNYSGIVDEDGNIIFGCEANIANVYMLSDGLFLVNTTDNGGYLYNKKTNTKTYKIGQANVYDREDFEKYGTYLKLASDSKYHYVDLDGNVSRTGITIEESYSIGVPRSDGIWTVWRGVANDGIDGELRGWINNNNVFRYDSKVDYVGDGIFRTNDGKLIDINGNIISTRKYDSASEIKDGFFKVSIDGKYGVMNREEEFILDVEYDFIYPEGDGYRVRIDGKESYADENGNLILPFEYDCIFYTAENEYVVGLYEGEVEKIGVVDGDNKVILPITADYDSIRIVSGGYIISKRVGSSYEILYGLVDKQNNVLVPAEYENMYLTDTPGIVCASNYVDGEGYVHKYFNMNGEEVPAPEGEENDNWYESIEEDFDRLYDIGTDVEIIEGVMMVGKMDDKWYRVIKAESEEGIITGVTLSGAEYTYDGTEKSVAVSGVLPEGAVVTYAGEKGTDAGTYNAIATITADGYKPLVLRATLKINPAPITVTADSYNVILGDELPELTYKVTSGALIEGDAFIGKLSTNARTTREGVYDVLQGTLKLNSNYKLTFVKGTITVSEKMPQNIAVSEIGAKTYGDESFAVTATADETAALSNFTYESSNPSVATIAADGTVTIVGAGETEITVKEAGNDTYAPFKKTQVLSVAQKEIALEAIELDTKSATIAGVLEGDAEKVALDFDKLTFEITEAEAPEGEIAVVIKKLVIKGEKAGNYKLTTETIETTVSAENIATVSVNAENGTVSGEGIYLVGSEVKLVATPASGYDFDGWFVGEGLISQEAEYSFVLEADIELTAKFRKVRGHGGLVAVGGENSKKEEEKEPETPAAGKKFTDLDGYAWAEDAVAALVEKGIVKGTSENTYSPSANIIRADFVALVVRMFDLTGTNEENFADVNSSDYFASELAIARNNGIVSGVGDNRFNPRGNVTRQDMMVMLYRAMTKLGIELEETTDEVDASDFNEVSEYAKEAVSALVANGIINGKNGKIDPMSTATRAEVAVMLSRVLEFTK